MSKGILILGGCFVLSGCGAFKPGGDEIGDGFLTEGGWDPFADERVQSEDGWPDEPVDLAEDFEAPPGADARPDPIVAVEQRPASGAANRLEDLFKNGDYRQAITEAEKLRKTSAPGSTDRDVADFIAGASNYYLGRFEVSQPILDAHVKQFPRSRHRESVLYYQASNRVRLLQWRVAGGMLENYMRDYPESLLFEFALFDRATCHFGLGEREECLKVLDRLERQFIYSKIRDRALALKGDVLKEGGDLAAAQASYLKAQEAAKELKHRDLEARCLANLTAIAAARGQNEEAIRYYESFFAAHAGSKYATKAALGGMPALVASGEGATGLANLERLLKETSQTSDASAIKDTLAEYAKYYRQQNGPEKLLRQLGNLSSSPEVSKRLREQLLIARLEALETYFPEREAEIRVFYKQMRTRFKPADLSSTNVLKMADYISADDAAGAVEWYENALARGGARHRAQATLGLAQAQAEIGESGKAENGFRSVLETFGSPELAEEATLGIARIAQQKKDWSSSARHWGNYLEHSDWKLAREEAQSGLKLAKANGGSTKPAASEPAGSDSPEPSDPLVKELAKAESLAAAGNKDAAYDSLDRMLRTVGTAETLPKSSGVPLRKAQMMHEDLAIELGK